MDQFDGRISRRCVLRTMGVLLAAVPLGVVQACSSSGTTGGPTAASATPPQPAAASAAPSPATAGSPIASAAPSPVASAAAQASPSVSGQASSLQYGDLQTVSDVGIYIALDQGYFKDAGLNVTISSFDSAANMVAPLGGNQLDAGGGALSAGLFNAFARNIAMAIVADKGHTDPTPPGFPVSIFLVRKALMDAGQVTSAADLKGRKIGWVARGIATELDLSAWLKTGGLTIDDVDLTPMGFPDMPAAFASGGIDAAGPPEPIATLLVASGVAQRMAYDYEVDPGNQVASVLYSPNFAKSALAGPFMTAYLRGVRLYNDGFVKNVPDARQKAISAAIAHTPVKDPTLYDKMALQGLNVNGTLLVDAIGRQQEFFLNEGTQQSRINLDSFIDTHFAQDAVSQLGPYQ